MGIFGALTTAVTGMQAQSFALQNISGNIANSQTTAYKRTDTSFSDLIQDNQPAKQVSGSVMASSRATNTVSGDIQGTSIGTFMAVNGDGFFVVMKPTGMTDNNPVFSGVNQFTRRGDFQPNKDGYLVNGAGYYLMGIPVDSTTGNLAGSVPTLLKFQNDFLPAQATTQIDYRANLARYPLTPSHDTSVAGSELLNPVDFTANPLAISPQPAKITGSGATLKPDANATLTGTAVIPGSLTNSGTFTIDGTIITIPAGCTQAQLLTAINAPMTLNGASGFTGGSGTVGGTPAAITIQAPGLNGGVAVSIGTITSTDTAATVATKINAALAAAPGGTGGVTVSGASGQLVFNSANGSVVTLAGDTTTLDSLGFAAANRVGIIGTPPTGLQAASFDASNHLVLKGTDARTPIVVGGSNASLLTELGVSVGTTNPTNLLTQSAAAAGQTLTIKVGSNPTLTVTFGTGGPPNVQTLADLNTQLATLTGGIASVNSLNGNVTITASSPTDTIAVAGTANALTFGMHTTSALPSSQTVVANDLSTFVSQSIGGGAITAYDVSGSPVNMQVRWAKVDSASLGTGHTDTWNMFYQTSSTATGTAPAWKNVGATFTFDANGQMNPLISTLTLSGVTIDGASLGNVTMSFGSGGITQFSDPNGNVQVNLLKQNGYAAGALQTIAVNDKGRVVGSYSNGRTIDLAQVTLAKFSGANYLKRMDGGAFEATDESGVAIYGASGKIVGSSLEGSNSDIADEFTKLIVTQQAYSANTRVITTSNQMVQDLLNMLR
ncbi:MAG: flagellar hook-basal body complex protein [Rhodoplanes sp.]|uniref:flagellar hook-basal body complex protein n=1 Tax=Rhodoplanes sp. TaxID=1968906 RepID=UPI00178DA869|nr:flagellar hook-basal body complex protein [Rhodoplanes sp.]NVO15124.1 flagellar hook-basal body complex protein [Rhodoplanes sp.]